MCSRLLTDVQMDESGFMTDQLRGVKRADPGCHSEDPHHHQPLHSHQSSKLAPAGRSAMNRSSQSLTSDSGDYPVSDGSITESSYLSDTPRRTRYEAESPDELALVKAASTYGCQLMRRSQKNVVVWLPGNWSFRRAHLYRL